MVYVDLDDVLGETARALLRLAAESFSRRVEFDDLTSFDLRRTLRLDDEEHRRFLAAAHQPDVLRQIAPTPGAPEALEAWSAAGLEVTVVTGRPPSTAADCRWWLQRHALRHGSLRFLDKYGRFAAGDLEHDDVLGFDELAGLELAWAVEDSLDVATELVRRLDLRVALLDRPWNRAGGSTAVLDPRICRCASWAEIGELVARAAEGG